MAFEITGEFIKKIHEYAIDAGVHDESSLRCLTRDEGTIEYIADKSCEFINIVEKASFCLFSIANYHPFVEGNKRTAILVAEVILGNHLHIDVNGEELNGFVRKIATPDGTYEETLIWMQSNVRIKK